MLPLTTVAVDVTVGVGRLGSYFHAPGDSRFLVPCILYDRISARMRFEFHFTVICSLCRPFSHAHLRMCDAPGPQTALLATPVA